MAKPAPHVLRVDPAPENLVLGAVARFAKSVARVGAGSVIPTLRALLAAGLLVYLQRNSSSLNCLLYLIQTLVPGFLQRLDLPCQWSDAWSRYRAVTRSSWRRVNEAYF